MTGGACKGFSLNHTPSKLHGSACMFSGSRIFFFFNKREIWPHSTSPDLSLGTTAAICVLDLLFLPLTTGWEFTFTHLYTADVTDLSRSGSLSPGAMYFS